MRVRELIAELQQRDPDREILVVGTFGEPGFENDDDWLDEMEAIVLRVRDGDDHAALVARSTG